MSVADTPAPTPTLFPAFPWDDPRVRRLEWLRFLIAASMVVTIIAETALLLGFGWYSLPVWLTIIGIQWLALHLMNKRIVRERALAYEEWKAEMDRRTELLVRARREVSGPGAEHTE